MAYVSTPDKVLEGMASHSAEQVRLWERSVTDHKRQLANAESALARWTVERDEQYAELDRREIAAP